MTVVPRAFVIGHPIAHSRSPLIHGFWLEEQAVAGSYERIDVAPDELADFVRGMAAAGFKGGNVTVPHKRAVLDLVDEADAAARNIGAANTLWVEDGRLLATNTDADGFVRSLDAEAPAWDKAGHGRAVVIGAGGAARAVVYGLLGRGFVVDVLNRSVDRAETLADAFGPRVRPYGLPDAAERLGSADLLVNTTTLGMAGSPPLDLDLTSLGRGALVCDIVYVPIETELLRQARALGHRTVGGLGMLLHQAVPGFAKWFGVRPRVSAELRRLVEQDLRATSPNTLTPNPSPQGRGASRGHGRVS